MVVWPLFWVSTCQPKGLIHQLFVAKSKQIKQICFCVTADEEQIFICRAADKYRSRY